MRSYLITLDKKTWLPRSFVVQEAEGAVYVFQATSIAVNPAIAIEPPGALPEGWKSFDIREAARK